MGKNRFRIIHLSDLHLTPRDEDTRTEPKLLGKLSGMNQVFRRLLQSRVVQSCNLLLITGDVTDHGDLPTWQRFWEDLADAKLTERTVVLPGNHDVCNLGVRPPKRRSKRIAADLVRARRGLRMGGQVTSFPFARLIDPRVVLFGLDSCNPGNLTGITNAVGELGFSQLETLARLLARHADVPVKIVALHHSPNIPRNRTARKRGVERMSRVERWGHEVPTFDRRALRLLCVTHRVRLLVHGHLHRAEDRRVNSIRIVGCPASTQPVSKALGRRFPVFQYDVNGEPARVSVKLRTIDLR